MADLLIDASELTEYGRRIARAQTVAQAELAMSVKKAAQNVKEGIVSDLQTSSHYEFSRIRIGYDINTTPSGVEAEISPYMGGSSDLANIAFFGTAKGGGTHWFYEFAEQELPTLARYAGDAAALLAAGALGL